MPGIILMFQRWPMLWKNVLKPVKSLLFSTVPTIGGLMEGPLLRQEQASFIGLYPVPLRHGLTIGEYAIYINDTQKLGLDLTVIPMKGWQRKMYWQDTGLPWVGTSPQILQLLRLYIT